MKPQKTLLQLFIRHATSSHPCHEFILLQITLWMSIAQITDKIVAQKFYNFTPSVISWTSTDPRTTKHRAFRTSWWAWWLWTPRPCFRWSDSSWSSSSPPARACLRSRGRQSRAWVVATPSHAGLCRGRVTTATVRDCLSRSSSNYPSSSCLPTGGRTDIALCAWNSGVNGGQVGIPINIHVNLRCSHSYYKNSYVTWTPGILSRHLANGCVLKCSCIGLMVFRNLSCLGIIICYINTIWIVPAYACNFLNVCDALV